MAPKAEAMFIMGSVTAMPDMAAPPTPCPTKMLSMILYSDDDAMAIMAGMAYLGSSRRSGSVPSETVLLCVFLLIRGQNYS